MSKATRRVEGFTCRVQRVEGDMYNSTCIDCTSDMQKELLQILFIEYSLAYVTSSCVAVRGSPALYNI